MSLNYNEALKLSIDYFKGDELAAKVFLDKYALRTNDGELIESTPDQMHRRIAKEFARIEKTKFKNPLSEEEIYSLFDGFKYVVPQGSPMFGIGNDYQLVSVANCFVVPSPEDSYSGILKTDQELVQISKRRGGVGVDISTLRPMGARVKNAAQSSTGIPAWMERYSNTIREVGQSGRRGALMLTIDVAHPDIENFITIKNDNSKVTGANISVRLSNEFLNAVKNKEKFRLRFPCDAKEGEELIVDWIDANELWKKIIHNAWKRAEPGILFWDKIINYNMVDCYSEEGFATVSTNPSLKGDTKILTKNGVFDIKELAEKNENIIVKNILGEWQNAIAFKSGINKELYEIEFTNRQKIYATAEHKHPIFNTNNDIINPKTGKVKKKTTIELKRKDKIYLPAFNENPININTELTNDDGFVCGWLTGDGLITKLKDNSKPYGFIFSEDDLEFEIGNRIINIINSKISNKDKKIQLRTPKNKDYRETSSSAIEVQTYFNNMNIQYKFDGVPDIIWKSNHEFISGYIDGLFSSGGCILSNGHGIVLTSVHEQLLIDIQKLLTFYGIRSHIKNKNYKTSSSTKLRPLFTRYNLTIVNVHARRFSEIFNLSNKRKQEKLSNIKCDHIKCRRDYLIVKSIKKTNIKEDVYDITVFDNTHTFQTEYGITGNCGEITLGTYGSCRLMVLNLFSYVNNPFTKNAKLDYDLLYKHAKILQRLLDDMIDLELEKIDQIITKIKKDPEKLDTKHVELDMWKNIKKECIDGRRTGLGVTAEGDMIAALNIGYGTKKSLDIVENVHKTILRGSYQSSVDMAKEIGTFPIWDWNKEKDTEFALMIKEVDESLYYDMKKYGRRNIANLTIAPCGSISLLTQTTSGIEPLFMLNPYIRRKKINPNDSNVKSDFVDQNGDHWQDFEVYHSKVKMWMDITGETDVSKSPWYGYCAEDIDWVDAVKLQSIAQSYIDHSISKCVVKDTLIETNDGLFYIDELTDFDNISVDKFEDNNNCNHLVKNHIGDYVPISAFYNNGNKEIWETKLENGYILRSTGNEMILVLNENSGLDEWIKIENIKIGNVVRI